MTSYQITSSAGVDMGIYEGETPADALDAMARDAGYKSQADAAAVAGPFTGTVVEVTSAALCDYETGATIREATEQETSDSIAQAERDGGAGVILVDGRRCYVEGGAVVRAEVAS